MKNIYKLAIAGVALAMLAAALTFAADRKAPAPAAVVSRFSEALTAPKGVTPTQLRVEIKDWHFVRTAEGVKLPATGFYVAQLKSGQIDTEIAGKREHRVAGDFWPVPTGESVTVIFPAHSQAAQIRTIAISPGAGKH